MTRKDWFDVMAPSVFTNRKVCKTLVNRTQGLHVSSEELKGRVFEANLADLNADEQSSYRKLRLRVEDVQGTDCLTLFHGMDMTRDKLCSLIKKWQTTIEAFVDVSTTDGYRLRIFCIGFTKKQPNQTKRICYAQNTRIHAIRAKMMEIMTKESVKCDLKELVDKLIPGKISSQIEKECQKFFPIQNVFIRKVKVLKRPKIDLAKLMEQHTSTSSDAAKVERSEVVPELPGSGGRL